MHTGLEALSCWRKCGIESWLGALLCLCLFLSLSSYLSLYLSLSVFVKCNAISLLVYIYLLLRIRTKFIYTGRLSSWKLCLCPCICLCVCLCLCLCHLQMKPGAVLFPTMYDMLNPTLESWKYWCFIDDRLSDWRRRRRRRRRRKAIVRSAPDGSDKYWSPFLVFLFLSWHHPDQIPGVSSPSELKNVWKGL